MKEDTQIKIGQVLWLKVRYQIDLISEIAHPMLIAKISKEYIEVIALDKTKGKMHQLYKKCNYYINSDNPKETVIYEDSYAQMNTKITLEWDEILIKARKTKDTLSNIKLNELLENYEEYQKNNILLEERIVHMTINEIKLLNPILQEEALV